MTRAFRLPIPRKTILFLIVAACLAGGMTTSWQWYRASASEPLFRAICYALIAAAVIIGLPALDGVLR